MSDDDIDLDRVIVDPEYRRKVIAFLNKSSAQRGGVRAAEEAVRPTGESVAAE